MTQEIGFICGLTNKMADFDNSCQNFRIDTKKKQDEIFKYKSEIDENINKYNSLLKRMVNSGPEYAYLTDKNTTSLSNLPEELIIYPQRKKKIIQLLVGLLMFLILGKSYYNGEINSDTKGLIVLSIIMILGGFYLIYEFFEQKEIFRISSLGIIVARKDFVPWNKIDFIHFEKVRSKYTTDIYLVLRMGLGLGDNKRIDVTYADMDVKELGALIYGFMKSWKIN